jgi:cytosine/adenosine deaminase-related metal-dependent hydrolase
MIRRTAAGAWPMETYGRWQNIRRLVVSLRRGTPGRVIWDLGRVPYDPEDLYIAQLIANLSQISEGVTCGTDTSQANHTPAHSDAMIKGLIDSGRRMLFDYSAGTDRSADGFPFEFPGR